MATAGIRLELETTGILELQKQLRQVFTKEGNAGILAAALKKALEPALAQLINVTPVGPTGNLKLAASVKVKPYDRSGNAVGLLGYRRAGRNRSSSAAGGRVRRGPDRAFHQWWLELGTKDREVTTLSNKPYARRGHTRRTKSGTTATVRPHQVSGQGAVIASSYKKLGPFKFQATPRPPRGEDGQRVQTTPSTPGAFFKKGKKGQAAIRIPAMQPGGSTGKPPLRTAWERSSTTVAEILQRELRISLERALQSLVFSATGTVD